MNGYEFRKGVKTRFDCLALLELQNYFWNNAEMTFFFQNGFKKLGFLTESV